MSRTRVMARVVKDKCWLLAAACGMACAAEPAPPPNSGATTGSADSGAANAGTSGTSTLTMAAGGAAGSSMLAGASSGGSASSGGAAGSAAAGGSAGTFAGGDPSAELLRASFDGAELGLYSQQRVKSDFGATPPWNNGLNEGRASIVEEAGQRFLRVRYPAGQFGPAAGGVQFKVPLPGKHDELFFAYRVRFAAGFDFVKGGKLPGLVGGTSPTGCKPDRAGFSARNMWRTGGQVVQYVYWPDQPNTCGDDLEYMQVFVPGQWHSVQHRVKLNTPGTSDGVLEGWLDGSKRLTDVSRLWRDANDTFSIDALYFSTFFGGGDASWAPTAEQVVDFDDLVVSTKPLL